MSGSWITVHVNDREVIGGVQLHNVHADVGCRVLKHATGSQGGHHQCVADLVEAMNVHEPGEFVPQFAVVPNDTVLGARLCAQGNEVLHIVTSDAHHDHSSVGIAAEGR